MGGGSTTKTNQTTKVSKWAGPYKDVAAKGIASLSDYFSGQNTSAKALDAYNNGTFSTPMNDLQTADYQRNASLMNNEQLNAIAGGANLDPNSDPYFQKNLDAKIEASGRSFAQSLDSANGSFQRGGIGDSSMAYRKRENMLKDQSNSINDLVNDAYDTQHDKAVSEMVTANGLLTQAGNAGYKYQAAIQAIKDGSLANAMKIYGLDASDKQQQMQFLQLISEPEQTMKGTSTTTNQLGFGSIVGALF